MMSSLDVVVSSYDDDRSRGGLSRSTSAASSAPARQHHHRQQQSGSRGGGGGYQYVPYKKSAKQSPVHNRYGSQSSLPSQSVNRAANQYAGFTSQGVAVQRSRGQQNAPRVLQSYQQREAEQKRQQSRGEGSQQHRSQGYSIAERQARSSSLKSSARHAVDRYAEFSDAHRQFNNHVPATYQLGSSSSENSPQGSPRHVSSRSAQVAMQQRARYYQEQQYRARQLQNDSIQKDLNELQEQMRSKHSSRDQASSHADPHYRTSSRNTYVQTNSVAPHRTASNDSFSFASSIKCCVGFQPKKKKSSRRALAYHSQLQLQKAKERERQLQMQSQYRTSTVSSNSGDSSGSNNNNWVSLSAVKSQFPPQMLRASPNQSTVSCPYTLSAAKAAAMHKRSSGYSSEVDSMVSTVIDPHSSYYESDGEFSDSEFARATAGSRGKSANSVMMKLAKKFSKKNLPITRDEGDGESVGGDSLEGRAWKLKHRSNSVSNLDSLEGLGRRSLSMEHLGPLAVNNGRSGTMGGTPQGSPRLVRSWSKGKLNRRSAEFDSDTASSVSSALFRSGSRHNLTSEPSDALFDAIEQGNFSAVASLIEANLITKFNMLNEDEFLPVDLSVMLGHNEIAILLLKIGAKDSPKFCRDPSSRLSRIQALISEAERDIFRLKENFTSQSATSGLKDVERKYKQGERRLRLYRRMLLNYETAEVPGPPTNVQLHITSNRSLMVTFSEPDEYNNAAVTRYKIEWCRTEEFKPVVGDFVMTDLRSMEYIIPDLDRNEKYFVRVSAYNMKGFGPTQESNPPSATPSSWHDLDHTSPRYEGCTDKIHVVAAQFGLTVQTAPIIQPANAAATTTTSSSGKSKSGKKTNPLTRMFTSTVKFHKLLKPGVYIASLVYSEETRVLVTTDDNLPIVEVSDSTSASIGTDFVWLANLACTWEHVQAMCDISDSYTSSPAVQFRNKLLHAVLDLQNALGMTDLGLLHPVPYKDGHGAIVFVIIQYVKDTKSVASGNSSLKWTELPKLWKRRTAPTRNTGLEAFPVPDQIVLDAQEIIAHHHTSVRPLEKGLYLGYLKARSSVASMKVICSREYPNVLPHIRIRDNPNISKEEWQWIKSLQSPDSEDHAQTTPTSSNSHQLQNILLPTINLFLKNLGFSKQEAETHQLYLHEAIELNENITLLLVMPPPEHVCTAPGSSDHFADLPDFVALPINTFEIMQLYTYQRSFMTKFSMVSARLEVEMLTSHQRMREAFSKADLTEAKEKKTTLEDFSARTEQVWRQMRWIEDAVQKGRDHGASPDTLLPVATVTATVEQRRKQEIARQKEEEKKREEIMNGDVSKTQEEQNGQKRCGYLRVIPTYRTGLTRGTSVKLFIESTTTTEEVITLVVKQVARATAVSHEDLDMSDFYLVASCGNKEWTLQNNYLPLQLQDNSKDLGKVFLWVRRKSEESQLNQLVTSV